MILQLNSLTLRAKLENSRKTLLSDVSLALKEGESLALIGETGSGKTMTAMAVMGLLPENIKAESAGIMFCGGPMPENRRELLGVEMVYIPQNGHEFLNPSKKVRGHLYDSLQKLGIAPRQREGIALQKLAEAGFEEPRAVMDKYPFQLSGGMAQRVTIAIAACSKARLVIADEPTNGLDHEAKAGFMDMLEKLFPKASKLIITHDMTVAALCDKVLVLCGGKMMEKGPAEEILGRPRHPYTAALLGALVENGMVETPILRNGESECPFYARCAGGSEACTRRHGEDGGREWWCSRI